MQKINDNENYTYQKCIDYKGKVIELCRKYSLLPPNYYHNKCGMDHMPIFVCNTTFRGKCYESQASHNSKKLAEHEVAFKVYCSLLDFISGGEIKFVRDNSPVRKITQVTVVPKDKYDSFGILIPTPDQQYAINNMHASECYPKDYAYGQQREIKKEPLEIVEVLNNRTTQCVDVGIKFKREPLKVEVPQRRTTNLVDVSDYKQAVERSKLLIVSLRNYRLDLDNNDVKSLKENPFFSYFSENPYNTVILLSKLFPMYKNNGIVECVKAFYDECQDFCGPMPHPDNYITRLVYTTDDDLSAARLATMFKEGSFNPYGNGQTTQYTITQPIVQNVNGVFICSSTCLMPGPITIIGTGSDGLTAFESWLEQINVKLNLWAPTMDIPFLTKLRTLPAPKDTNHPLYYLWHDENSVQGFIQEFMTGSFNPYGNGQPNVLTRGQWIAMNKKNLANKTKAQTETMYQSYITKRKNQLARTKKNIASEAKSQIGTQNKTKSKTPKTLKTKQNTATQTRDIIKLSMCAKFYAAALACPFWWLDKSCHTKVESLGILPTEQPCIPSNPTVMSRKMNFFIRVVAGVQADGSAFVSLAPRRIANDYSTVFNNTPPLLYSTSINTYAPGFPVLDTGIAWAGGAANNNGDYNSAATIVNALGQGILYRVVGAGLRVRYIGKLLDESGIAHCVIDPDHYSLGGLNINQIGQFETYFNMQVSPDWITLTYTPVAEEEFQYQPDALNNPAFFVGRSTSEHFMGIAFSGLPPGDNIAVEVIVHYEALGRSVRGKTQTPSDVVGTGIVLNAVGEAKQLENNDPASTVKSMISKNLPDITMDTVGKGITSLMAFL